MRSASIAALALSSALAPARGAAQTRNEDFQLWTFATISKPIAKQLEMTMDIHIGLTDDASRPSQLLLRPSLAYRVNDRLSVGGGYAYLGRNPLEGDAVNEHRVFQQLDFVFTADRAGPQVRTTTRLEQRFEERGQGTGWRLRHQTRFDLPIPRNKAKVVVWNEMFYSLNATEWTGNQGFSAMFNYAGISVPLSKKVILEPGYLNFRIFAPGRDRVSHIAAAFMAIQL